MTNLIQDGHVLSHTVTSGEASITAGDVVIEGQFIGVAATSGTYANSDVIAVNLTGVYQLDKTTSLAITKGDKVYWNTSTGKVTKTATDRAIGIAWSTESSDATSVEVKLDTSNVAPVAAVVAANTTANGSDASTTQALANSLKTTVNNILTELKAAGLMASS